MRTVTGDRRVPRGSIQRSPRPYQTQGLEIYGVCLIRLNSDGLLLSTPHHTPLLQVN